MNEGTAKCGRYIITWGIASQVGRFTNDFINAIEPRVLNQPPGPMMKFAAVLPIAACMYHHFSVIIRSDVFILPRHRSSE